MTRPTDHSQLDLHQLNLDVAHGRSNGLIIWQPRILCWFTDKAFSNQPLPERYQGMSEPQIYRDLGCSNRVYNYGDCFREEEPSSVVRKEEDLDIIHLRSTITTPVGELTAVYRRSRNTWYRKRVKQWIETSEDMIVATWILDNSAWFYDPEVYHRIHQEWGDIGAPCMCIPRVSVENLYLDMMNIEKAVFALFEWGAVIDDYFRALHENHMRLIEVVNHSPIDMICYGDNLHASTLSPKLYEKYVLPAYWERSDRLHEAGKFIYAHWDGDVGPLLPYAQTSGLDGIEAITPVPQGDVTLEKTKEALGDDIVLLDGIPALYFDSCYPEEELIACTERVVELFAPKLVLGISDEIASNGDLERVRIVGKWVDDYNAAVVRG